MQYTFSFHSTEIVVVIFNRLDIAKAPEYKVKGVCSVINQNTASRFATPKHKVGCQRPVINIPLADIERLDLAECVCFHEVLRNLVCVKVTPPETNRKDDTFLIGKCDQSLALRVCQCQRFLHEDMTSTGQ